MNDITTIKSQLAARAESIARELFPAGQKHGAEWCVGSISGEKGQSLKIHLTGDKAGVWTDFATGDAGDLLDLYCAAKNASLTAALSWAKDRLGIQAPTLERSEKKAPYRKPVVKNVTAPKSAVMNYLTVQRGLKPETLKAFQIGERSAHTFYRESHTCPAVVFPFKTGAEGELLFVKYLGTERPNEKKLIDAEANCEPILFGWQAFPMNQRRALICEGEINAMSWHQFGIPALATPFGAGKGAKHSWLASEWERLEQFEEIYLNFDPDPAGREAVADLVERLGRHRCLIVPPMPDGLKDANDCLFAGVPASDMAYLLDGAQGCDPEQLRRASEFTDDVISILHPSEDVPPGIPLPADGYGDKFRFRPGELTIISGYRGHGKTEAINWLANHWMKASHRVCVASFEMKAPVLLARAVRQMTAQRQPSTEYIKQIMRWYYDRLWIYDHVGRTNQDAIFEVFEYAFRRYGVSHFVIDSLMKCGIRGDDLDGQDAFANRCSNFAKQFNVHLCLVAHTKKMGSEDAIPRNDGVKGSGGITDQADNVLAIWRNKPKERAMQKLMNGEPLSHAENEAVNSSDVVWALDKQREGDGWIGDIRLNFDSESKHFVSVNGGRVLPLLGFYAGAAAYNEDLIPEF